MVVEASSEGEAWAKAKSFDYLWDSDMEVTDLQIERVARMELKVSHAE